MSSEHLVYDVEKSNSVVVLRESPRKGGPWKCLAIFSFMLLIGATLVFALLQFGALRLSENQDSKENGNSFSDGLPQTMKVQALVSRKPAAHAIANLTRHNQLIWTTKIAPSMLENGMQLNENDNSLVVPSTGLYFIYSQLLFHGKSCTKHLLLTHTVLWKSAEYNRDVVLLKSIKSACEGGRDPPGQEKMWFKSIYQGVVSKLHKGDRLWSQTDSPEHLDLSRHSQIYFGVIAM